MKNYRNHRIVQITRKSQTERLAKIQYLLMHRVSWEKLKLKSKSPTQCKNCQRFGHTATNCLYGYRCVKCTKTHDRGQCPRNKIIEEAKKKPNKEGFIILDDRVACVNCKQKGHPANHKSCPFYQNYIERKAATNNTTSRVSQSQSNGNGTPNQQNRNRHTYAGILKGGQPNTQPRQTGIANNNKSFQRNSQTSSGAGFGYQQNEWRNLFGTDLIGIIKATNEFLPVYRSISNVDEKKEALIMFIFDLCN